MKVSQDIIDKIVSIYLPSYRYLKEAEIDFPLGRGLFQIGQTEYYDGEVSHMTDVETQLCLNQLCYVLFNQEIANGRWDNLKNLTLDDFLDLRKENMFVTESHKKFRRETRVGAPFVGEINLNKVRRHGNLFIAHLDFDLNNGAAIGELSVALRK